MHVKIADLDDPEVRKLIALHQQDALASSPPGYSFALDITGLQTPSITVLGAWENGVLIAIGAIKRLWDGQAEIKSMRTHPDHLRKGAARVILDGLATIARNEGIKRLSLETGTGEKYAPAQALYRDSGFSPGQAFADYSNGPHNQCWHKTLD